MNEPAPDNDRPKNLARGRWLGDLEPLSAPEQALVAACARGDVWYPEGWNDERPPKATDANTIRSEVIRFLMLGGDAGNPVHERGVTLGGAWIKGELNLLLARCAARLDARRCHFEREPVLTAAHLPGLVLSGSRVPGLCADGAQVTGDVYLSNSFLAEGEVRLLGAEIGGDLSCSGGGFRVEEGDALSADRIKVTGGVFLKAGFLAEGAVRLLGAHIGGNLDCSGGRFKAEKDGALSADRIRVTGGVFLCYGFSAEGSVRLLGAEIRGDLACSGGSFIAEQGNALNADGLRLTGTLFLRETTISGAIDLAIARIGTLNDGDRTVWESGHHVLDGFHYDRIIGVTDAESRIAWLKQQSADQLTTDFKPQPWEQLIKVLREMGHPHDAAKVAIAKQQQFRKAGKIKGPVRWLLHKLYGVSTGYGYRPLRLVGINLAIWIGCSLWYSDVAKSGIMAPSNVEIIAHRQLHNDLHGTVADSGRCGVRREVQPAAYWPKCAALPSEYTTFFSPAYSLDLILPLVDLQQERDWAPAVSYTDQRGQVHQMIVGHATRALMWFEILFGWTSSLVLIAVLGRLVEKD